jgi:integrase
LGKFADYLAPKFPDIEEPKLTDYKKLSVAWCIQRFIEEMDGGVKPLGQSHRYILRMLQRSPIGAIGALKLKRKDVIEHCRARQASGVKPQTVQQDVTYLSGVLKYASSAPHWDCDSISSVEVDAAKPFLAKHNLIAKAQARTRRPTPDELEALLAYFERQNAHHTTKVDMVKVTLWQNYSARRIGETCKLLWADWDRAAETMIVRNMKDPKRKDKTKTLALTPEAQAMLVAMWDVRDESEPRIFPYCAKTCSQRHTLAKKALGFGDLRLHDNRRDRGSRLVEQGYSSAQSIQVTGHDTPAIFEKVYCRPDVAIFKQGPMQSAP